MAAPAYGSSGARTNVSGTSLSLPPPTTHAAGDLLIIHVGSRRATVNSVTVNTPAGWTLLGSSAYWVGSLQKEYLFWKYATSSSEPNVTVSSPNSTHLNAMMHRFTGVHASSPIDTTAVYGTEAAGGTTVQVPALTTSFNNALMVYVGSTDSSNVWTGPPPPTGATLRASSTTVHIIAMYLADETKTTAGLEAADTWNRGAVGGGSAIVAGFALREAAAAAAAFVPRVITTY